MNKKQRIVLITIIFLASLGLIAVQLSWIEGAYKDRKSEFGHIVSGSMNFVVTKIWQEEVIDRSTKDSIKLIMPAFMKDTGTISFMQASENPKKSGNAILKHFVEQVIERMIIMDVPIEQRVTITQVDTLLRKDLVLNSINIDFNTAICDAASNILMTSETFSPGKSTVYEKRLFPDDPENPGGTTEKYYVRIYFPHENSHLIKNILPLAAISGGLIFCILALFIYTMWIILRQKKISEIKGDFISNITHELKTPIATISLAAQLLEDKNVSIEKKDTGKLSNMIKEQSKHLSYLVEKVLQTSVFEKQAIVMNSQPQSMHQIISEAIDVMSLQLRNKKADFSINLEATKEMVLTDKPYFLNVITNLIDNALKYGGTSPAIKLSTLNKNNNIIIAVKDNGIGISKENQSKIFDQFYRVSHGNVHDIKGFGLGLNYVKKIVEMSNGTISLESKENMGTTFFITLPLYKH